MSYWPINSLFVPNRAIVDLNLGFVDHLAIGYPLWHMSIRRDSWLMRELVSCPGTSAPCFSRSTQSIETVVTANHIVRLSWST
jgi:hypothetical protein